MRPALVSIAAMLAWGCSAAPLEPISTVSPSPHPTKSPPPVESPILNSTPSPTGPPPSPVHSSLPSAAPASSRDPYGPPEDPGDPFVVPGSVSVIFWDQFKVRPASSTTVSASDKETQAQINAILERNSVQRVVNLGAEQTEEQAEKIERATEAGSTEDVPNAKSIFVLDFQRTVDTRAIAKELAALPCVRAAYRSTQISPPEPIIDPRVPQAAQP